MPEVFDGFSRLIGKGGSQTFFYAYPSAQDFVNGISYWNETCRKNLVDLGKVPQYRVRNSDDHLRYLGLPETGVNDTEGVGYTIHGTGLLNWKSH